MHVHRPLPDVTVLNDQLEIPGLGHLPVNAFVLHAESRWSSTPASGCPTGTSSPTWRGARSGRRALDLAHPPRPRPHRRAARPAGGGAAGAGRHHVPRRRDPVHRMPAAVDRVHLLNPGQAITWGTGAARVPAAAVRQPGDDGVPGPLDRRRLQLRLLRRAAADARTSPACDDVRAVPPSDLQAGQLLWATVDSPWVHRVDPVPVPRARSTPLRAMARAGGASARTCRRRSACTDRLLDTLRSRRRPTRSSARPARARGDAGVVRAPWSRRAGRTR